MAEREIEQRDSHGVTTTPRDRWVFKHNGSVFGRTTTSDILITCLRPRVATVFEISTGSATPWRRSSRTSSMPRAARCWSAKTPRALRKVRPRLSRTRTRQADDLARALRKTGIQLVNGPRRHAIHRADRWVFKPRRARGRVARGGAGGARASRQSHRAGKRSSPNPSRSVVRGGRVRRSRRPRLRAQALARRRSVSRSRSVPAPRSAREDFREDGAASAPSRRDRARSVDAVLGQGRAARPINGTRWGRLRAPRTKKGWLSAMRGKSRTRSTTTDLVAETMRASRMNARRAARRESMYSWTTFGQPESETVGCEIWLAHSHGIRAARRACEGTSLAARFSFRERTLGPASASSAETE